MDNKKYTTALLILLLFSTGVTIWALLSKQKAGGSIYIPSAKQKDNSEKELKSSMWDSYLPLIREDEGRIINGKIPVSDTLAKKYTIKQLSGGKFKLVFRYSFRDCDVCVDTVMNRLRAHAKNDSLKDVLVIADAISERDFVLKVESKKYPVPMYNLDDKKFGLSMENKGLPFLFILTPDFRVIKLFIPVKELSTDIDGYIKYALKFLKEVESQH